MKKKKENRDVYEINQITYRCNEEQYCTNSEKTYEKELKLTL